MPGFWSSNLFADITLVVQVLFFLVLSAGVIAQLQGKYKVHDRLQIPVVVLNLFFIALVMIPTFRFVVGALPEGLSRAPTWVTLLHAFLGAVAQLLALYCLLAGLKVLPRKIGTLRYWMWAAYAAWTAAIIFGIGVYVSFYLSPVTAATESIATGQDGAIIDEHAEPIEADAAEPVITEAPAEQTEVTSEHAAEAVQEAEETQPAEEIPAADQEVEQPEPEQSEPAGTGPMPDTDTFPMDELISEHAAEITELVEPEFSGEALPAEWTRLETAKSGPGPRYEHAMIYQPATNQVYVYGGRDGNQITDTSRYLLLQAEELAAVPWQDGNYLDHLANLVAWQ